MPEARRKNERGFSLLELLASISILVVIAGGVFSALSYYLGAYQRTQLTVDIHDTTRSAIDTVCGLLSEYEETAKTNEPRMQEVAQ